ncbi:MAG: LPS export ABC transporter permease LptG [Desulfobacterales bacterium]|nr:LPS export ABC transporter permease LptG [Desulfobacterales bacterium]
MTILHRYLTKQILKYFAVVLIMVIAIYLSVDFFEKIDNFSEKGVSKTRALFFFFLNIPFIVGQITPAAIILAVIIVFGLMNKNNELIALKSCGISSMNLLKSPFFIGIALTLILFFLNETIIPISTSKADAIWLGEVEKRESYFKSKEKNIWIKGNRSISHITYFNPDKKTIFGITINFFDDNFRLIRRMDASRGEYKEGYWFLYDVLDNKTPHDSIKEKLDFLPEDLHQVVKKSQEMTIMELSMYIKKIEKEGYDAVIYKVDFYAKTAFPFICLIMSVIGSGISFKLKTKDALPISIAYGIAITFSYWIFYSFCLSLGYGEMLPPYIAAWITNIIFICFGAIFILNSE